MHSTQTVCVREGKTKEIKNLSQPAEVRQCFVSRQWREREREREARLEMCLQGWRGGSQPHLSLSHSLLVFTLAPYFNCDSLVAPVVTFRVVSCLLCTTVLPMYVSSFLTQLHSSLSLSLSLSGTFASGGCHECRSLLV